jgi:hypothetical protein
MLKHNIQRCEKFSEASGASPNNILQDGYRTQSGHLLVGGRESEKCQKRPSCTLQLHA